MRAENRKPILLLAGVLAALALLFLWPRHEATPTPETPAPTAVDAVQTPIPGAPGLLRIEEIMVKNAAALPDEDGDFPDWIELHNISGGPLELEGWRIADREVRWGWSFPELTLRAGERLLVFADRRDSGEVGSHRA